MGEHSIEVRIMDSVGKPAVPELTIGTVISGCTVVAAIAESDRDGHLPGLHVVTAQRIFDDKFRRLTGEFVTWQIAWRVYTLEERMRIAVRQVAEGQVKLTGGWLAVVESVPMGRWVASGGHYFAHDGDAEQRKNAHAAALQDMLARWHG